MKADRGQMVAGANAGQRLAGVGAGAFLRILSTSRAIVVGHRNDFSITMWAWFNMHIFRAVRRALA